MAKRLVLLLSNIGCPPPSFFVAEMFENVILAASNLKYDVSLLIIHVCVCVCERVSTRLHTQGGWVGIMFFCFIAVSKLLLCSVTL